MRLARFDSRRFQVDIPRPYSIRSAQKTWVRAGLFSELAASGAGTVTRPARRREIVVPVYGILSTDSERRIRGIRGSPGRAPVVHGQRR